jgi:hypothetical protein
MNHVILSIGENQENYCENAYLDITERYKFW